MDATTMEYIKELFIALVFSVYVVMYLVEFLKKRGIIGDSRAGHWNEGLSFIIGMCSFIAVQLHIGQVQINSAAAAALALAPGLGLVILTVLGSKLFYKLVCWIRGGKPPTFLEWPSPAEGLGSFPPSQTHNQDIAPTVQVVPLKGVSSIGYVAVSGGPQVGG